VAGLDKDALPFHIALLLQPFSKSCERRAISFSGREAQKGYDGHVGGGLREAAGRDRQGRKNYQSITPSHAVSLWANLTSTSVTLSDQSSDRSRTHEKPADSPQRASQHERLPSEDG
jgi:hypothetical protein